MHELITTNPKLMSLYQGIRLAENSGKPLCYSLEAKINGSLIPVVHKQQGHETFAEDLTELLTTMQPEAVVVHLYQGLSPKDHSEERKHTHTVPLMSTGNETNLPTSLEERLKDIQERTELRVENKRLTEKLAGAEAYIEEMDEELEAKDRLIEGLRREVHSLRLELEEQEDKQPAGTLGIPGVGEVNVTELAGMVIGGLLNRYLPQIENYLGVRPQPTAQTAPPAEPKRQPEFEMMPDEEA